MNTWNLPAPRVLVAIVVTVIAVVGLGIGALLGGDDPEEAATTTTAETTTTTAPASGPSTSIEVDPEWYPKRMSRYSDRQPAVTVTTLASTTLPVSTDEPGTDEPGTRGERRSG